MGPCQYNGEDDPQEFTAYEGKVYVEVRSSLWMYGRFQALQTAGTELTGAIDQISREAGLLCKFAAVGDLVED